MTDIDKLKDSFEVVDAVDEAAKNGDVGRLLDLLDRIVSLLDETDDRIDVNVLNIGAYRVSNACGLWHPTVHLLKNLCDSQEETDEYQPVKENTKILYANALAHTGDLAEAKEILISIIETSESVGSLNMAQSFLEYFEVWEDLLTGSE